MLHKNLKKLREEYDISQERLGKYMKVTLHHIQAWEQGDERPSQQQLQRLAQLFQIDIEELQQIDKKEKRNIYKKSKGKQDKYTKTKTKKKTKYKTKHKHKRTADKQVIVKKRKSWPIIFFMILLIVCVFVGGAYMYRTYGGEYFIGKKGDYKTVDLAGTFAAENTHGGQASSLILKSDANFTFETNLCDTMHSYHGTWKIHEKNITMTSKDGTAFSFHIESTNQIRYTSKSIACGPFENDIFTRGALHQESQTTLNTNDEKVESKEESNIKIGSWKGEQTQLQVIALHDQTITFTLSSTDANDPKHIAVLSDIKGDVNGNQVIFSFMDDGYGNAGTGTLTFDTDKVTFAIVKTTINPQAVWAIKDQGTLY